jgi:hypothetical protein
VPQYGTIRRPSWRAILEPLPGPFRPFGVLRLSGYSRVRCTSHKPLWLGMLSKANYTLSSCIRLYADQTWVIDRQSLFASQDRAPRPVPAQHQFCPKKLLLSKNSRNAGPSASNPFISSGKSGCFPRTRRNTPRIRWRSFSDSFFASLKLLGVIRIGIDVGMPG